MSGSQLDEYQYSITSCLFPEIFKLSKFFLLIFIVTFILGELFRKCVEETRDFSLNY